MKTKIAVFLALCLLLLVACSDKGNEAETGTDSLPGETIDIPVFSPETEEKAKTETDAGDGFSVPEGENVFRAESEEELNSILSSDAFLNAPDNPILIIGAPFALSEAVVIERAVDFVYLPETCPEGASVTVKTREKGKATVKSRYGSLVSSGFLVYDAPFLDLIWEGTLPSHADIDFYCNVASLNGAVCEKKWGGEGKAEISEIRLLDSSEGKNYDGVEISVFGNYITLFYPLAVSDEDLKEAKLTVISDGKAQIDEGEASLDLSLSHRITVTDGEGNQRSYYLYAERKEYKIPLVRLYTDDGEDITSKTEYSHGRMLVGEEEYGMNLRGRGNASWTEFPKKSYRIRLDESASLFGFSKDRDYVLICNYTDKSLIRNCVATDIAKCLSGLAFTPSQQLINLYLNGKYLGVYAIAEKIEDAEDKLPLGEGTEEDFGFLLEIGWDYGQENVYAKDYFDTDLVYRIFIKEPEITEAKNATYRFIRNYVGNTEKAIRTDGNWEDYIDADSFVDWLIVNELTNNTESSFYRSCFLWREAGGKLHLGPVWDFDMAFGNHQGDIDGYDGWCTTEATYHYIYTNWMTYLMQSPRFCALFAARWEEMKEPLLAAALNAVDSYSALLEDGSADANFEKWNILGKQIGVGAVSVKKYPTWEKQVEYVRDFVKSRWEYIEGRIASGNLTPQKKNNA